MLEINPISAFSDNYIWLLRRPGGAFAAVVDPGDAVPVIQRLRQDGLSLEAIMITHKHGDHVGGVKELKRIWPEAVVYGPAGEPIPALERALTDGDQIKLDGVAAEFLVLDVPGHTEGHIAYLGQDALFCGDTLFAAGCGRVFSGTHEQLHRSLQRIAALPPETRIYCAHEYTLDNLGFAAWVEPKNKDIAQRRREAEETRAGDRPTVPSRLGLELRTNPFLRSGEPAVVAAAERYAGRGLQSSAAVFKAIRTWKDREYD
ncbi:MAG: hydroxyacylglutathione hydrolase [Gammaproteobacteria bacterium]|nr:hydroxyacylglutathione hydrolase [Gammaproteobacteria bacterium]HXK57863.1 hydroxyacylglutathione hydrolase [Gammaproteobacteria bacterium]